MGFLLIIESGQPAGATYELADGEHLVGRGSDCHIKLTSSGVSRQQLRFIVKGDQITVENLSQYGSQLEGKDLTEPVLVQPGQRLSLGLYTILRVEAEGMENLDVGEESSIWDQSVSGGPASEDILFSDIIPDESDMTDPGALRSIDRHPESGFVDIWAQGASSNESDSSMMYVDESGSNANDADPDQPAQKGAAPVVTPSPKALDPEAVDYLKRRKDLQSAQQSRLPWIILAVSVVLIAVAAIVGFLVLR